MSDIVLYKKDTLQRSVGESLVMSDVVDGKGFSKMSREVILATYGNERISKRNKNQAGDEIRQLVNRTILQSGFGASLSETDLKILIIDVVTDVLRDFSALTVQEVQIAFRNGVREEYGEYMGVSVRIFYKWVRAYIYETKVAAQRELKRLDKPKVVEVTQEQKDEIHKTWIDGICKKYDSFLESEHYGFQDWGGRIYSFLDKLGLIKISKAKKKKILADAKGIVKNRYRPINARTSVKRDEYKKMLDKIASNDKSVNGEIKSEAKKLALKMYLDGLRKKKANLRELIEQAQAK